MLSHLPRGIVVFVVITASNVGTANAAPKHRPMEHCGRQQTAKTELSCARRALYANMGAARWIRNHTTRALNAESWSRYWYVRLQFLAWRVRVNHRQIAEAHRRLAPEGPRIAHIALWLCIHRGEGAWDAATGNGYYGGLQMTYGWGGVARPDLLAPSAQMALAERQYAASGYSAAWLAGQWPNTSPPCMGLA